MTTPFLQAFAVGLVHRLTASEHLIVREGSMDAVVAHLAAALAEPVALRSLISTVSHALIACDDVEDLFADDDEIKAIIDDMGLANG